MIVAPVAVAGALGLRWGLETLGRFYYLPLIPAVALTALVSGRVATALAIGLAITANVWLAAREGVIDAATNALLFAAVAWGVAELCWSLREARRQSGELSSDLAAREAILDTLLKSVPVLTLDRQGRVCRMNAPAEALFGTSQKIARGQPVTRLIPSLNIEDRLNRPQADTERREGHWEAVRANGQTFPLDIQFGRLTSSREGEALALCLTDLTRSHAADAQARELHAQLNKVWRLNSLGEMAATLAHELNQPLSAAATYLHASQLDMEKAGPLGDSARRTSDLAKGQLLRAGKIIRRMRELLTLEMRSLGRERASSLVEDLVPILTMIGRTRNVAIRTETTPTDDNVRADRIQIQQAMVNLVRNAVEAASDDGSGQIVIIARPLTDDIYEISVEDNGPGINPDQVERIFQPMTTTKSGGMGLGLSVTRTIVESHGGNLKVGRGALGGAAFSFGLMRDRASEDA